MRQQIRDEDWERYEENGYLPLGKVLSDEYLVALQRRNGLS